MRRACWCVLECGGRCPVRGCPMCWSVGGTHRVTVFSEGVVLLGVLTRWVTVFSVCECGQRCSILTVLPSSAVFSVWPAVHSFPVMQQRRATKRCPVLPPRVPLSETLLVQGSLLLAGPFLICSQTPCNTSEDAFVEYQAVKRYIINWPHQYVLTFADLTIFWPELNLRDSTQRLGGKRS